MLAMELTPSTMSSAGCRVSFRARRIPATSLVTPVAVSLWVNSTALIRCEPVSGQRLLIPLDRRAFSPLRIEHLDIQPESLGHVDPEMAEHPEAGGKNPVARGKRVGERCLPGASPTRRKQEWLAGSGFEDFLQVLEDRRRE